MFRPSFVGHHQVVSLIQGNSTICGINTLRTGDADLSFYVTTVQDG